MNVLYQFNEAYVPYAGVSIFSLLENNRTAEDIVIYILGEKLQNSSIEKISQMIEQYKRKVVFIDGLEIIALLKKLDIPAYRGSYATNLKMFFPLYADKEMEKVLYIDSDTLVLGDISPLFGWEIPDAPLNMILDSMAVRHKQYVGHEVDEYYYNGGVMLFNINCWNEHKCTERIIEHVKEERAHYMAPDQDILNVALKNEIKKLPPQYNLQPLHYRYSYDIYSKFWKQEKYYSKDELEKAIDSPVIIHFFRFLGEFPWNEKSQHPYTELFNRYLEKSPWSGMKKEKAAQEGMVFKIERLLYKILPDSLFMFIFKIGYESFIRKAEHDSRKGKNHRNM